MAMDIPLRQMSAGASASVPGASAHLQDRISREATSPSLDSTASEASLSDTTETHNCKSRLNRAPKQEGSVEESINNTELDENDIIKKAKRRLFVCVDGTWKNASNKAGPLTNVARFARSVDRYSDEGSEGLVQQIVYYSGGVGTHSALPPVSRGWFGVTGAGLEEIILSSYTFLCNNYNFDRDVRASEIILVGYSRGAFAVRCLADLISQIGLLRRKYLGFLPEFFKRWMETKDPEARKEMRSDILSGPKLSSSVKITALCEWDPVSAIGVTGRNWRKRFSFVKDEIPLVVTSVFTAVAIHERRRSFKPMLWKSVAGENTKVTQRAFLGCHGDVGGGNRDAALSTISLLWMISNLRPRVEFDMGALFEMFDIRPSPPGKGVGGTEFQAVNLIYSEGAINESLKRYWWVLHKLTLGWYGRDRGILQNQTQGLPVAIHWTVKELYKSRQRTTVRDLWGQHTSNMESTALRNQFRYELKRRWPTRMLQWLCIKEADNTAKNIKNSATTKMILEPDDYEKDLWEAWFRACDDWDTNFGDETDAEAELKILGKWRRPIGEWSETLMVGCGSERHEQERIEENAIAIEVCQILEMRYLLNALESPGSAPRRATDPALSFDNLESAIDRATICLDSLGRRCSRGDQKLERHTKEIKEIKGLGAISLELLTNPHTSGQMQIEGEQPGTFRSLGRKALKYCATLIQELEYLLEMDPEVNVGYPHLGPRPEDGEVLSFLFNYIDVIVKREFNGRRWSGGEELEVEIGGLVKGAKALRTMATEIARATMVPRTSKLDIEKSFIGLNQSIRDKYITPLAQT
ncbi:hypothetical protein TWF481_006665 [Arthrobotrys musiformis]|uniref:T6SS Phospholipase effector Tle1-like catalytic domain-containing protein n=1 Tax=Arthrobotrys musiformis TaxID=47236 RepID=A0AAV9WB33_9PEZI